MFFRDFYPSRSDYYFPEDSRLFRRQPDVCFPHACRITKTLFTCFRFIFFFRRRQVIYIFYYYCLKIIHAMSRRLFIFIIFFENRHRPSIFLVYRFLPISDGDREQYIFVPRPFVREHSRRLFHFLY